MDTSRSSEREHRPVSLTGQKRGRDKHDANRDPDGLRRDPGQLRDRNAGRTGRVRNRAGESRQQVSHPVRGHRALHGAEVHRAGSAPGHALDGDRVPQGLDGPDQGHEHERGEKSPADRPEVEIEARPACARNTDPRGLGDAVDVVDPEEHDGHHRYRDQHDDGPRHGRSQDPPEEREPRGERELEERRGDEGFERLVLYRNEAPGRGTPPLRAGSKEGREEKPGAPPAGRGPFRGGVRRRSSRVARNQSSTKGKQQPGGPSPDDRTSPWVEKQSARPMPE